MEHTFLLHPSVMRIISVTAYRYINEIKLLSESLQVMGIGKKIKNTALFKLRLDF